MTTTHRRLGTALFGFIVFAAACTQTTDHPKTASEDCTDGGPCPASTSGGAGTTSSGGASSSSGASGGGGGGSSGGEGGAGDDGGGGVAVDSGGLPGFDASLD